MQASSYEIPRVQVQARYVLVIAAVLGVAFLPGQLLAQSRALDPVEGPDGALMDEAQQNLLYQQVEPGGQAEAATPLFEATARAMSDLSEEQLDELQKNEAEPTTEDVRLVRINIDALRGDTVLLEPDPASSFTAQRSSEPTAAPADMVWTGELTEVTGEAVLVVNGDQVTGNIRAAGELYHVQPIGGGMHAIIRVDQQAFPEEHPPEFEEIERDSGALDPSEMQRIEEGEGDTALAEAQFRELALLVAYTPAVRSKVADVNGLIALAIAEANLSYRNSRINLVARLVDSYEANYTESGNFSTDVARFRNKNDSFMDEVHGRRDQFGADIAVLIMDNGQYCGLASAILAQEQTGFAGVHYTCAAGNYTFAHELGHLQGARHNPEADSTAAPFAFGHGYFNQPKKWRTVMSYDCPSGCTRLAYWSNPNVTYNGDVMGTAANHDNARVLNQTSPIVTGFRSYAPLGAFGYAWAHNPATSSYTPSATYAHNSAGGVIEITRQGAGQYAVRFAEMGGRGTAGGNVQVTAYGTTSHNCKVSSWWSGGPDFVANVRCFNSGGQLSDTLYTVSARWP